MNKTQIIDEVIKFSKLMYERGYSVASEGNISYRISDDRILITPSGLIKKFIENGDIVEIDMGGNPISGNKKPSTELFTHIEIYKNSPQTAAIVHSHPFYTVLLTAIKQNPLERIMLSEAAMFLKNVYYAPYAKPSTREGADAIRENCGNTNIIVIDRHGSFTYGESVQAAFSLLEILEKYSKMYYYASISGREIDFINEDEVKELSKINY